jgi:hypothetical protein
MGRNTSAQLSWQLGYNPYMSLAISRQKEQYSISSDLRVTLMVICWSDLFIGNGGRS